MALLDYALTTLADVKAYLGITVSDYDALLETLINSATDFIEGYCGRRFKKTVYVDELYDGHGKPNLFMKNYPIISVEEMHYIYPGLSDEEIDISEIRIYENEGYIYQPFLWRKGHLNIQADYTAGYDFVADGIPPELQGICNELVSLRFSSRGKSGIKSERMGNYSIAYGDKDIPNTLVIRLNAWKKINVF